MVVVSGEGDAECPIIKEWLKIDELVYRATTGKIALCIGPSIDRSTVAENHELLIPLVTQFGALLKKYVV